AALARILAQTGRHGELASLLEDAVQRLREAGRLDEALTREVELARLHFSKLGDSQAALVGLKRVLTQRPAHPAAVKALEELASEGTACRTEAAWLLEPVLEARGDYRKLLDVLEIHVAAEPSQVGRVALLRKMSELFQRLGQTEQAYQAIKRALRE